MNVCKEKGIECDLATEFGFCSVTGCRKHNIITTISIIPTVTVTDAPMVEYVPVVHGEWIKVHDWLHIPQEERGTYRCSACGQVMKYPWNYCPNCGAKMEEKP